MAEARLKPYLRTDLDVLFIGLNPPEQSNSNGHYFSGKQSRFFELLAASGLITRRIPRACADETVFGTTEINYKGASFGVVDLVSGLVETKSEKVSVTREVIDHLVSQVRYVSPRFACVIHAKVWKGLNRHGGLVRPLSYGLCGLSLKNCATQFVVNYFPSAMVSDDTKISIFRLLRDRLE
jgi:G:T/U-mismatch repair DNA glycosylase